MTDVLSIGAATMFSAVAILYTQFALIADSRLTRFRYSLTTAFLLTFAAFHALTALNSPVPYRLVTVLIGIVLTLASVLVTFKDVQATAKETA